MKNRSRLLAIAASAVLGICVPGLRAEEPARGNYADEIKALRQRLDELETQQKKADQARQVAEQKLEERLTSEQLRSDAAHHDEFLTAEGFTAGYSDGRFVIQSGDGNFSLRPWAHLQFRGVADNRQDFQGNKKEGGEDQWDVGFEVRRMRFGIDGNLFSPDFTYFFNWNTYRSSANSTVSGATPTKAGGAVTVSNNLGGVLVLEEAWVKYHLPATPFYVQLGQVRDPVLHDQIVDARYQQSAERSLTADIFANGDGLTEGVMFIYDPHSDIHTEVGFNHGMRSANTNFLSYPDNGALNAYDYGVAGRAEYKVMGRWKDYNQVGAVGTTDPLLVLGVGADYSERGHAGQLVAAADAMFSDPCGLSVYGAFVDRYTTHSFGIYTQSAAGAAIVAPAAGVANGSTNEYSLLLQAGYLIDRHIEPFGRYEYIKLQGTPVGSRNYLECATGGVNYYFHGQQVKVTGEVIWLPQGLPMDDSSSDVLINANGKSEVSLVIQLQLAL